jgi:predicted ATPase
MAKSNVKIATNEPPPVITQIIVENFKSIVARQSVEVRPLTIFAGANSSGKSSIMQAVLLLKQTLEASYDPGALLLDGPHAKFTSADQFLSRLTPTSQADQFVVGIGTRDGILESHFLRVKDKPGFQIEQIGLGAKGEQQPTLNENMTSEQVTDIVPKVLKEFSKVLFDNRKLSWSIKRNRCFLQLTISADSLESEIPFQNAITTAKTIPGIIHLPGLRGNPSRSYPVTAVGKNFPGTFEYYTASVISLWQSKKRIDKLNGLNHDLEYLGLTYAVTAKAVNDSQVELQVGRLPRPAKGQDADTVNIADVGFGVSQTLPVLVALHVAEPHHLVYLEQPEIHLHPRAQYRLASVLAAAINRGVRVVVETHSSILLLGLQTLVASGTLAPDKVKLHWFTRGPDGRSQITPADLDDSGAFGKWPEDFGEVDLEAENAYLDAAEVRLTKVAKR